MTLGFSLPLGIAIAKYLDFVTGGYRDQVDTGLVKTGFHLRAIHLHAHSGHLLQTIFHVNEEEHYRLP